MFSNYIIISTFTDGATHTFYVDTLTQLASILKTCTFNWCSRPKKFWENGEPPKFDELFWGCWDNEDFGDIATILEYNPMTRSYIDWDEKVK
jgi:hypothetical protein